MKRHWIKVLAAAAVVLFCQGLLTTEAISQPRDAGIYGRVWVNSTPSPNVEIAVYFADGSNSGHPIAATTSRGSTGPHSGYYDLSGLPSGTRLRIEATHPTWPDDPGVQFVTLNSGEAREVHLNVTIRSAPGPGHPGDPR